MGFASPLSPTSPGSALPRVNSIEDEDFTWIAGGEEHTKHQKMIAVGGYGEVHQMFDSKSNTDFARKIVRPFGTVTKRDIETEMRALKKLSINGGHPNIITILRHKWRGHPFSFYFIDMELCDTNLHNYIYAQRPELPETSAFINNFASLSMKMLNVWTIMIHITQGLAFIHSYKQVHRDLKPRNGSQPQAIANLVLYSSASNSWKIADFGTTVDGTSTRAQPTSLARGTASYRAPELLSEDPMYTNKLDIWALGCILFELAMEKVAFIGDWDVLAFSLKRVVLQFPESSFPKTFQVKVSTAVEALLRRDWRERPKAVDICAKFVSYSEQSEAGETKDETKDESIKDPFEPRDDDSEPVSDWKALVRHNPNNLGLHKRLADAYKREGNLDMEVAVLKMALSKDPNSQYYQDQLTDAYNRREDVNLSALGWKQLFEHPEDWVVVDSANKEDANVQYWKEQLYKNPGELHLQQSLVKAFRRSGDIDAEIATFNDLIRRFPGAWYLADRLAEAYKHKGDMEEAIVSWKELVNMQPGNTWWQVRLVESYTIKGDIQGETRTWRELVKRYPNVDSLQERLAAAYNKKLDHEKE